MIKRLILLSALLGVLVLTPFDAEARVGGPNVRFRSDAESAQAQAPSIQWNSGRQLPQQQQHMVQPSVQMPVQNTVQTQMGVSEYVLGVGDRIRLTVYGEADLSGDYEVSSTGIIAVPLIGDVVAAGQPLRSFEQAVRTKLSNGYLKDPRVSAQVTNYRPFFILGEVTKPGSYPYVNGMTVVNAVALAGGYTYRADDGDIRIKRAKDPTSREAIVKENEIVMPGDVIRVPERYF